MDFLETIARERLAQVHQDLGQDSIAALRDRIAARGRDTRSLAQRLRRREDDPLHAIAEVKRASPSAGVLQTRYDPAGVAVTYEAAGASGISVLTEPSRFGGSIRDLMAVREKVSVPVLLKDFVVHERQLYEARAAGADAALLIAGLLSPGQLREYAALAREIGLEALVEIHEANELERALSIPEALIGVNNRDLRTLTMRAGWAEGLISEIPSDRVRVAESGYSRREEIERLTRQGWDAVLVGESLLRAASPAEALRNLLGGTEPGEVEPS